MPKKHCLPIYISHNCFFSVLQKHKVDWGLLILWILCSKHFRLDKSAFPNSYALLEHFSVQIVRVVFALCHNVHWKLGLSTCPTCAAPPTSMGKWYRFSNKQGFWCYISIPDYLGTKKDPERSVLNSITFRKNSGDTDNMGCSFRCCSEKRNSTGESTQSLEMITCIFSNAWEHSMLGCVEQCSKCGDEKVQKALHCCAGFLFLGYLTF